MHSENLLQQILSCLDPYDETEMARRMAGHYQTLHLLDAGGNWASPLLESRSKELLPDAVTFSECNRFLQQMMELSLRNPFFASFLEQALSKRFPVLEEKFCAEGSTVIPDALAFALVLDRLTRVCCDDFRILEACHAITMTGLRNTGAYRMAPFFYRIKLRTVASSVTFVIQAQQQPQENLKHNWGSRWLRLNILEAVFSDLLMGFFDNARAGRILAVQKTGRKRPDSLTGAGPCCWSADGKTVCLGQPFVKSWDDLYQIWNMAFLSKMGDLPYIISKLLIPEVSGYADHPGSFMHKRLIALYLYMAWLFFDSSHRLSHHLPMVNWYDPALTRFWGSCAREAAREYALSVKTCSLLPIKSRYLHIPPKAGFISSVNG